MQEESKQSLWSARLQDHAASGQPIRAWCAVNGVTEATFHYWRKRLAPAAAPSTKFIALPVPGGDREQVMEVETPTGYVIRLRSQGQLEWLGAVVMALR